MDQFNLLPKEGIKPQGTSKVFKVVLVAFLIEAVAIITLVSMFFIVDGGVQDLDKSLADIKKQQLEITDVDYLTFKEKRTMLTDLQKKQIFWSEALDIIEKNTSSDVEFLSYSSEPLKNKVIMNAKTVSFDAAAKQLQMFREVPNFRDVEISQVILDAKKGTLFNISLTYNKLKTK